MRDFSVAPCTPGLYYIVNVTTGRIYIGSSKDVRRRWRQHWSDLEAGNHHCAHLQNSWNVRGSADFEFVLIAVISDLSVMLETEDRLIKKFKKSEIYNSTRGAVGCFHSEETKRKIGDASRGKPRSEVTKVRISATLRGTTKSAEHRLKIGQSQRGKIISPEVRAKMSAAHLARSAARA